jgi:hypothetical protein
VKPIACALVVIFMMLLIPSGHLGCVGPGGQAPGGPKSFTLEVVATTMTQIVLQWEGAPANASSLQLQRATAPTFAKNPNTTTLKKG